MTDLKLALRTLTRSPFVTAIAVVSLALGIGANAAIFSIFDQLLMAALPVQDPGALVSFKNPGPIRGSASCTDAGGCDEIFSYPMYRDLERSGAGFSGIAAHRTFGANLVAGERTLNGTGMFASGSYFPVLGLQPYLGRLLTPDDDRNPGEHTVAVLSHGFWERELGADPGVLNRTIIVNGQTLTIVGVAPPGFKGTTLGTDPDVFVPISMRSAIETYFDEEQFANRRNYWVYVFGRRKPGLSMEQAAAELNAVYTRIINDVDAPLQQGMSATQLEQFRAKLIAVEDGRRGQSQMHRDARTPVLMLFSITGLVLLIACANIANLLLVRGAGRTQEMAIRGSLGASRRRMMGQLLTESLLLAAIGGLASVLVAGWTLDGVARLIPPEAAENLALRLRPTALLFTAGLSVLTGLLFGMYPALNSTRPDLVTMLKSNTGQASSRAAARFRSSLVTAQIALSMVLLMAAGLFLKSLVNVTRVDLGLRSDRLVAFGISPALNGYDTARSLQLFQQVEQELAAIPGVTGVTAALVPLLAGSNWGTDVEVQGFETGPEIDSNSNYNRVGPAYFSTLGVPLIAGREFDARDGLTGEKVAIVNEAFAEKFGLGRDAVGKMMSGDDGDDLDTPIVGLVQNAKYSEVKDEVPPLFFVPYRQDFFFGFLTFYVRTGSEPEAVMRAIPEVIKRLDPNLPVENLKTLDQQIRENIFLERMISTLSSAFATLATILAAIGLYGVLAYSVAQRTREIGLRMALGAGKARVRALVLKQVTRLLVIGAVIGLVGALAVGRAAQSLLFGLEGHDPWVVVAVTVLLSAIALGAAYIPALRASRVDPMQALRYE
jgi:predicted permease